MSIIQKFPREKTSFKTDHFIPGPHFTNLPKWDHFTMHVPTWDFIFQQSFVGRTNLSFLELGTGNGLCSNYLLEKYDCTVDTVDVGETREVEFEGQKYYVSTLENLHPFIEQKRCKFFHMDTRTFFQDNLNKQYDFVYVDASHDKDWVLFDCVMSFEVLKKDGLMILDDYGWGNCGKAIDCFLECYQDNIQIVQKDWQVILLKDKDLESRD